VLFIKFLQRILGSCLGQVVYLDVYGLQWQ